MSMIATKVETHRWVSYAKLVGFTLAKDEKSLPGMVSIDVDNFDRSLDSEVERLKNDYGTYDATTKKVTFGPWFTPVDRDEIAAAIQAALV